jgi:hypothetical protein
MLLLSVPVTEEEAFFMQATGRKINSGKTNMGKMGEGSNVAPLHP